MNPKKAEYVISAVSKNQYPKYEYPTFVFLGRSNVGKSSFINALTNRKNLAYTSSKPGKTVALNFYNIDDKFLYVDVPGYGYAQKRIEDRIKFGEMIEEFLNEFKNLKTCFLILDIRHEPTSDDILMYNYLKHFNKPIIIVATKADKISKNQIYNSLKLIKKVLGIEEENICYPVSSLNKNGIQDIEKIINTYE